MTLVNGSPSLSTGNDVFEEDNGVPIESWFVDETDRELLKIQIHRIKNIS